MNTLKTLTAALFTVFSFSAFASDDAIVERLKLNYAVQTYIDAISHGKVKEIAGILDSDVKLTMNYGDKLVNYGKADILRAIRNDKGVEQNCSTEYAIIEQNPAQTIIKVTLKYDGFSRVNLVNMANTSKGWKITNISSVFL
jgi:hypothetical protein